MSADEDKESLARAHLPYCAEYCKTGRARCKKCTNLMEASSLKLANMTKSRFHDGYDASWYHIDCFFRIKRPASVAEIRHFETLKYEDQKMLERAVETKGQSILGSSAEDGDDGEKKAVKRGASESLLVNYEDFLAEYAKSGRATCNLCDQKIEKATVRLGKLDYEAETNWNSGPVPRWFHVECFVKSREQLEFFGQIDKVKGYKNLEEEDQKMLKNLVKPLKPKKDDATKKIKKDSEEFGDKEEEAKLKKQSDRYFALREQVDAIKRKDLELLLSHMKQKSDFKTSSQLVDMATDVLMFGPLKKCPECDKRAGIVLRGSSYICTQSLEFATCTYETRDPKRDVPDIPEELMEKYEFFQESYKFKPRKRLFSSRFLKAVEQKEAEDNNLVQDGAPLDGLTIGLITYNALKNEKSKIQKKVTTLGGKLVTALDRTLFVIMSSKNELDKETPKVEVAKELGVPIATDDFLFEIKTKDDVVPALSKCVINEWKGDLDERFTKMNVNQLKSNIKSRAASSAAKSVYKSSRVPKSQLLIVRDGTAVDPDSNLAEVGRVYKRGPNTYSVVLNSVDVAKDKNSYYKMQIIEHEMRKEYHLYRSWGRIGCEIGGTSCRETDSSDDAIETFETLFKEKTGNLFCTVAAGKFKKLHGRYFPVEVDYSSPESKENEPKLEHSSDSILKKPVQGLISFIFDVQQMHRTMKQFELDSEKMPLGKLSTKHILAAMATLKELEEALEVKLPKKPAKRTLTILTNKFFSYIPQSFGDGKVELIDSIEQIQQKSQMLADLREIEIAFSMCSTVQKSGASLPIDQYYTQLDCAIDTLGRDDGMFQMISDYVSLNHAITHGNYELDIIEIFKIQREQDMKEFKEHKEKRRVMLWHGSKATNFAGILSKGLRVAPAEAPTTGFMFGKGIYFADMSSKAANYCMSDPSNPYGLLLLCEVALGKCHDFFESEPNLPDGLREGCDSVLGVGKSTTNSKTHVEVEDGILIPIGKQVANKKVKSQLLYNEYVVYKESQVMPRYVVQVKFNFK